MATLPRCVAPWAIRAALAALPLAVLTIPAGATDFTVDTTTDQSLGSCNPGNCSLRDAIALAGDDDTISFTLGGSPPWTIHLQSGLGSLSVSHRITISGPGTADLLISGDSGSDGTGDLRPLVVELAGDLTMSGLTLRDGRATASGDRDGGCVKLVGALALTAVRFENCRAWAGGVSLMNNSRGGEGGAIYVTGGATLSVSGSTFVSNRAGKGEIGPSATTAGPGGRGGAIANLGATTILDSTFTSNLAGDGGQPNGDGGGGGAIANLSPGTLLLEGSTLNGNHSGDGTQVAFGTGFDGRGGALHNTGTLTLNNDTLSGNATGSNGASGTIVSGGGIDVAGGTARLRNVTVTANTSGASGGGVDRTGGTLSLRNTLVAGNSSTGSNNKDCFTNDAGSFVSEGYNLVGNADSCVSSLIGTDQYGSFASPLAALLDSLTNNGGPTATHALQSASPAIDAGDPTGCAAWDPGTASDVALTVDQRGEPRPLDGDGDTTAICDVGAYEAPVPPPVQHQLAVTIAGSGSGSVASTPPGIDCPGTCSYSWDEGTGVDLGATPDSGSVFDGWSGACTGTDPCSVTLDGDRSVTATFVAVWTLTVSAGTGGTVTSTPAGISCPGTCAFDFADGTPVSLGVTFDTGYHQVTWSDDCTGTAACDLTMSAAHTVGATFDTLPFLDGFESGDTTAWSQVVP